VGPETTHTAYAGGSHEASHRHPRLGGSDPLLERGKNGGQLSLRGTSEAAAQSAHSRVTSFLPSPVIDSPWNGIS
jgi:hypothetical protein